MGGLTVAVLAVALILSGFGAAIAVGGIGGKTVSTSTVTTTTTNSSVNSPYVVTLVIATGNTFNKTAGEQPAYYVLGPKGLESSAKISLPAHRLIKLVIVNYDEGNGSLVVPNDNVVSGTSDGTVFVASELNTNSSQGPAGIVVKGGQSFTSVPPEILSHTFTVPSLNLNIPVPLSSTVVAFFTVEKAGTYLWFCYTACGDAAMSTPGWMTGSLAAS
jgi:hypothetical protein